MNKTELVNSVISAEKQKGNNLPKGKVESIVNSLFETIRDTVKTDGKVQIIGFGTFSRATRAERTAYSGLVGREITTPEKNVAKFKPSSTFLD